MKKAIILLAFFVAHSVKAQTANENIDNKGYPISAIFIGGDVKSVFYAIGSKKVSFSKPEIETFRFGFKVNNWSGGVKGYYKSTSLSNYLNFGIFSRFYSKNYLGSLSLKPFVESSLSVNFLENKFSKLGVETPSTDYGLLNIKTGISLFVLKKMSIDLGISFDQMLKSKSKGAFGLNLGAQILLFGNKKSL